MSRTHTSVIYILVDSSANLFFYHFAFQLRWNPSKQHQSPTPEEWFSRRSSLLTWRRISSRTQSSKYHQTRQPSKCKLKMATFFHKVQSYTVLTVLLFFYRSPAARISNNVDLHDTDEDDDELENKMSRLLEMFPQMTRTQVLEVSSNRALQLFSTERISLLWFMHCS